MKRSPSCVDIQDPMTEEIHHVFPNGDSSYYGESYDFVLKKTKIDKI